MGLFQAIAQWNTARQEKLLNEMKERGDCPDCYGRGFTIPTSEYYISPDHFECPSCNGSGRYVDWNNNTYQ
ncbi:methionine aminopeptidase [Salipaludibacillus keqinensis]|uniref:Methionine aminopeptidase n=1 Tax=Salipaludibacillus keqinensis TaxID=2045207 RepID=A0A323TED3_9BACI|nr:methionine aminopeptidase [Salipaludibacillus keqinensis]PYZ93418.1 methionine aminopeptidase [Salipaludibacillus keqinensis]